MELSKFVVSVDPVIFSIVDNKLNILLMRRQDSIENNKICLPGGVVDSTDIDLESATIRVLGNKTGVKASYLEQLYSRTGHDPRGLTVSISYLALVNNEVKLKDNVFWADVDKIDDLEFAFDHKDLIDLGLKRLKNKVNYSSLPVYFMDELFTLPDLQNVYELILGEKLDKSSWRKKIEETNMVVETNEYIKKGAFRPAKLYKASNLINLNRNFKN